MKFYHAIFVWLMGLATLKGKCWNYSQNKNPRCKKNATHYNYASKITHKFVLQANVTLHIPAKIHCNDIYMYVHSQLFKFKTLFVWHNHTHIRTYNYTIDVQKIFWPFVHVEFHNRNSGTSYGDNFSILPYIYKYRKNERHQS